MITDVRREEMSKFAALSGCTIKNKICFLCIEPKSIVCHPARDITQSRSCVRERSASVVDKDMYIRVSSAYT